jgi:hypothetical protein
MDAAMRAQILQGRTQVIRREGHAFAHADRRSLMIEAKGQQEHGIPSGLDWKMMRLCGIKPVYDKVPGS